jgi:1,4-alpha-glucan branching enzyme
MSTARHRMPFGADVTDGGSVWFRLLAPNAERVALVLGDQTAPAHPPNQLVDRADVGDGWRDGYYADYAERPASWLARGLAEGFGYQGERSAFRHGAARGTASGHLPPTAFVNFLQNHDQIGNRAFGERLHQLTSEQALRAATAMLLLAPAPPLLFMGQELVAERPFLFFCDFGTDLARSVTEGRRREFARFAQFADEAARQAIPDPNDPDTFARCRLDWREPDAPAHRAWLELHRALLALRHAEIIPRLKGIGGNAASAQLLGETGLMVRWTLGDGSLLTLLANLGDDPLSGPIPLPQPTGDVLHLEPANAGEAIAAGRRPAWAAAWYLDTRTEAAPDPDPPWAP